MIKEKLVKRVSFRMTSQENEQLEKAAEALGCRPSDALRAAVSGLLIATGELASVK